MKKLNVEVVEYNKQWTVLFEDEALKIRKILGKELIDVHHIGSTAVENLMAKPIIDIMPVVKEISRVDNYNSKFEDLGYEVMGEFGMAGRRYFRKGSARRTHQIHIFEESNSKDIERHIAVRDYLRKHPMEAFEYGQLKSRLAASFPTDIISYMDGKDSYVKELEIKALGWYGRLQNK